MGPEAVLAGLKVSAKKPVLDECAGLAARLWGHDRRRVFELLLERERLGSTGVGGGIAIPHARLAGMSRPAALFARLAQPVEFDAIDQRPVDLVFMLLSPDGAGADHLKALARLSRTMRDRTLVEKLRATDAADALFALLVEPAATLHAA